MNNGSGLDNINRGIDALIRQYSPERLRRFDTIPGLNFTGKLTTYFFRRNLRRLCQTERQKSRTPIVCQRKRTRFSLPL